MREQRAAEDVLYLERHAIDVLASYGRVRIGTDVHGRIAGCRSP